MGGVEKYPSVAIFINESFGEIYVLISRNNGCDVSVKCQFLLKKIKCPPT